MLGWFLKRGSRSTTEMVRNVRLLPHRDVLGQVPQAIPSPRPTVVYREPIPSQSNNHPYIQTSSFMTMQEFKDVKSGWQQLTEWEDHYFRGAGALEQPPTIEVEEDEDADEITYKIPLAGFSDDEVSLDYVTWIKRGRVVVKAVHAKSDITGPREVWAALLVPKGFNEREHYVDGKFDHEKNLYTFTIRRPQEKKGFFFRRRPKKLNRQELQGGSYFERYPLVNVTEHDGKIHFSLPLAGYKEGSLNVFTVGPGKVEVREAADDDSGLVLATLRVPTTHGPGERSEDAFTDKYHPNGMYVVEMRDYPNPTRRVIG